MAVATILVTGITGFIGGAAAVEVLRRQPACRLLLLIRGADLQAAQARLRLSLARFVEPAELAGCLDRCAVLPGDLTEPAVLADPRLDQVTHVLHLAANTSFRSVRAVRHTNVLGTMMLAHRMRRVRGLQRFVYVSTAYICGPNPTRVVYEDDYPRLGVRHLAEYTASKAECELLLERTAPELPLVIARPSVVVGHTRLGCLPSASIFWYYRALDRLARVPAPLTARKDIIPVDYAAAALVRLLLKPVLAQRRYHISTGESASVSWQEIADEFAVCRGGRQEAYRVVDFAALSAERDRIEERLGRGDQKRLLEALEHYFRFSASGVAVFDNQRLLAEGMPAPPPFTSYLRTCATMPPPRSVYEEMVVDV